MNTFRTITATIVTTVIWTQTHASAESQDAPPAIEIPWPTASGGTFAVGAENGLWAGRMTSGLRAKLSINDNISVNLRPFFLYDFDSEPFRMDVIARLELHGATDIYFNVLRVYGGGGVHAGTQVDGVDERELNVGFGGHVGFEAFISATTSFFWEVGAAGGNDDFASGGTAVGGVLLYL